MPIVYEYDSGSTTCFWVHLRYMKLRNQTQLSEFLLLGFSEDPALKPIIFQLFLSMHVLCVIGNMLIVLAILSDPQLHMLMYFLLGNLPLVNVCFTSTIIPKMLVNIQTQSRAISYAGCITQMFFFIIFATLGDFLLAVMAYDQFVVICHPLHYTTIMNSWLCVQLVLLCWAIGVLHSLLNSLLVLRLSFCTHLEIPHFFCELNQVIHRACSDTFLNDLIMDLAAMLLGVGHLSGILFSYSKISSSICTISSTQGRYKAFSTHASHLLTISPFYGTTLGVYLSASAAPSSALTAAASVMYTVVTSMLNPFIYSLRNTTMIKHLNIVIIEKLKEETTEAEKYD
ncbi:putative olfactory receptor 7A2 [Ochotona princeps]|uniref:putative olfactory receptor 7A2 n=1 Tax=Ochotona princeps TaxID=9978 RepID=UPI002714DB7F|nr:putative olfactory receptor 7A2 [Ochotona princeps]